jgi:hypothetical protein
MGAMVTFLKSTTTAMAIGVASQLFFIGNAAAIPETSVIRDVQSDRSAFSSTVLISEQEDPVVNGEPERTDGAGSR